MNKRLLQGSLMVWVLLLPLAGEQVVDLPQINRPEGFFVGNDTLFILEKTTIHMYALKGYAYLGKFGKEGEGPGEIKKNPYGGPLIVAPHRGKIYVTSMGKLSVFSMKGEFIREQRVSPYDSFYPFADRFVCIGSLQPAERENKLLLAVFLADADLRKGKPLYVSDFEIGQNVRLEFPFNPFYPVMTEDRLFIIAGRDGFAIDAFDVQGRKLYRIAKREPAIDVPSSYREETERAFKRNPSFAPVWDYFKQLITYKKYYPPIRDCFVDDGRIYVLTYRMKGGERECIVLDLKGKELKRMYLPIPEQYGLEFTGFYAANRSILYLLREDEAGETWKLHVRSLK